MPYFMRAGPRDYWRLTYEKPCILEQGLPFPKTVRPLFALADNHRCCAWVSHKGDYRDALSFSPEKTTIIRTIDPSWPMEHTGPDLGRYCQDSLNRGWIDPEGRYYPIVDGQHVVFFTTVIGKDIRQSAGWIHAHPDYWTVNQKGSDRKKPSDVITPAQAQTLRRLGYSLNDCGVKPATPQGGIFDVFPDWRDRSQKLQQALDAEPRVPHAHVLGLPEKIALQKQVRQLARLARGQALPNPAIRECDLRLELNI